LITIQKIQILLKNRTKQINKLENARFFKKTLDFPFSNFKN
jgi:hypothetical protein